MADYFTHFSCLIDVGSLDVAVLVGYPGSQASFWQRAGRVGRRGT